MSQFRESMEECTDIEDILGFVPLRYLSTWSQLYCRIGSACPPSEAAMNVVTNDRASLGTVARDDSGCDSITHMHLGVMTVDVMA